MIKRLKPLHTFLLSFLITSCLRDETIITTDFDYVKLTETKIPLSPFYCKGVIRGMPFSYSTNDNFYADTFFPKVSDPPSYMPFLFFSVGNFGEYLPVWVYIESHAYFLTDFIQKLKATTEFPIVDNSFYLSLYVRYTNQYIGTARYFDCCTHDNQGILKPRLRNRIF